MHAAAVCWHACCCTVMHAAACTSIQLVPRRADCILIGWLSSPRRRSSSPGRSLRQRDSQASDYYSKAASRLSASSLSEADGRERCSSRSTIFVHASCFSEPGSRRAGNLVVASEGLDLCRSVSICVDLCRSVSICVDARMLHSVLMSYSV